jgi:uncharacterized membrane protein YhdT
VYPSLLYLCYWAYILPDRIGTDLVEFIGWFTILCYLLPIVMLVLVWKYALYTFRWIVLDICYLILLISIPAYSGTES